MKDNTRWVIVDTETDGLFSPIHVVEIAAQAMVGWEPRGEPFRVFLNHGVPIPYGAVAAHGYTREFLEEHGIDPTRAHGMLADFMQDAPMVCHNMRYDWTCALEPEWARLGVPPAGRVGFCSMLLSRRVIHETGRHNLDTLKAHFRVQSGTSHHALADVDTVVRPLFYRCLEKGGRERELR